jgi:hypothetical protein
MIHSNSWGSSSPRYDDLAAQVDEYHWEHREFLAVFAAGNDGDRMTRAGESGGCCCAAAARALGGLCKRGGGRGSESGSGDSRTLGRKLWFLC